MFGLKYQQALIQKWLKGKYHKRMGNTNFKIIQNFLLTRLKICWILGKLFIFIGGIFACFEKLKGNYKRFFVESLLGRKANWIGCRIGLLSVHTRKYMDFYIFAKSFSNSNFQKLQRNRWKLKKAHLFLSFFESFRRLEFYELFYWTFRKNYISEKAKSLFKIIQKSLRNFVDTKRWISNSNCQSNTHIPFTNPFSFLIYEKRLK
jgi:hypothetical protein